MGLGSVGGSDTWAVIATLVEDCKLSGVDPYLYLADVLSKIVYGHPTAPSMIVALDLRRLRAAQGRSLTTPLTDYELRRHYYDIAVGGHRPANVVLAS